MADLPAREHVGRGLLEEKGGIEEAETETESEDEIEDERGDKEKGEEKREEKKKPPPTQFQEPDASSLLDAFGF